MDNMSSIDFSSLYRLKKCITNHDPGCIVEIWEDKRYAFPIRIKVQVCRGCLSYTDEVRKPCTGIHRELFSMYLELIPKEKPVELKPRFTRIISS